MRRGWEIKRLGDVIKLEYGKPLPDSKRKSNGKYPVYGANGVKDRTDECYYNKKSIIVGRKGSAGEVNLTKSKFWPLDVTYYVIFDENKYDLKFLYNLLISLELTKLAKGVKPGINRNEVYNIEVAFQTLPEQKQIVAILDEAFEGIEKIKNNVMLNLKKLEGVLNSLLFEIFNNGEKGWNRAKLGECFKLKSGVNITGKMMNENFEYPVYGGNGIAGKYNSYNLESGNLIIGRVGALCGNVRHLKERIWITDNAFKITDRKFEFDNDFLTLLLNFKKLRNYARQAAQPVISNSSLEDVELYFPRSLTEQKTISTRIYSIVVEVEKLQTIYLNKIEYLEELKKSILQKAFSGKLLRRAS